MDTFKKQIPQFYKVVYRGTLYGIGLRVREDDDNNNKYCFLSRYFIDMGTNDPTLHGFNKYGIVEDEDKVYPLDSFDDHLAILDQLRKEGKFYNRKTKEVILLEPTIY